MCYICVYSLYNYIGVIGAALISVFDSNQRLLSNLPSWHIKLSTYHHSYKNIPLHLSTHTHMQYIATYIFECIVYLYSMYIYIVYVPWLMFWHNHYVAIIKLTFWWVYQLCFVTTPAFLCPLPLLLGLSSARQHDMRVVLGAYQNRKLILICSIAR